MTLLFEVLLKHMFMVVLLLILHKEGINANEYLFFIESHETESLENLVNYYHFGSSNHHRQYWILKRSYPRGKGNFA